MKAIDASSLRNETRALFVCSVATFLEILIASIIALSITRDPKNAAVLGLSLLRLGLVGLMLAAAAVTLVGGFALRRRGVSYQSFLDLRGSRPALFYAIVVALAALFTWGWLALFSSNYLYGRWSFTFDRLRPLGAALGLAALQVTLVGLALRGRLQGARAKLRALRGVWIAAGVFLAAMLALLGFIAATKIGLVHDITFWNMPGMPLSGVQYAALLALLALAVFAGPQIGRAWGFLRSRKLDAALFIAIYLAAVIIWGATPLFKQAFSLQPTPPAYQPYPASDARVHDSGGIAILKGYGILFKNYTDKPLYMTFLALLHAIGGYDYKRITLLQVAFLALIPALLYALGRAFHSRALGIFVALAILLRQRNAIDLAYVFDSGNPKLFTTEVPTMLGLILFSLVVFLWLRNPKPRLWMALLAGGALGAVSLVRANPMLLLPAVGLLALLAMVKLNQGWRGLLRSLGRWALHGAVYLLGFAILVGPWVVTGVNADGQPWLILKFQDVINVRYSIPSNVDWVPGGAPSGTMPAALTAGGRGTLVSVPVVSLQPLKLPHVPEFIPMHTLHNVVASVISLPDSLVYEDLRHLSQRSYWHYQNDWQGELGRSQAVFVALNLALLALGLGFSWAVYGWSGLAPLLVFGVYALSLGLARNSGSRYLVPLDWVAWFYFGLGLTAALTLLRGLLGGQALTLPSHGAPEAARRSAAGWKGMALSLVGLALLGSLIPIANVLLVRKTAGQADAAWAAQAQQAIPAERLAGSQVLSGEVFYPYDALDGAFSFGLLNKSGLQTYAIPGAWLAKDLRNGEPALVGVQMVNGEAQVQFIYAGSAARPRLLWVAGR